MSKSGDTSGEANRSRFAFYGRVSTEDNQDPTLSIPRQLANCERAVEGIGGLIVAHFYDIESGAARLEARGSGRAVGAFDIPIPRDGGLLDLLEEAREGRFEAVVCESINRFARNPSVTFRAEEELREAGVKLWATDEPWEESFGSIVLRHVNVGIARGYLHELKIKSWQGVETAARQGRHAGGKSLYGYRFKEVPHPNPQRAARGYRAKVLEPDPVQAPIVRMIFEDYVVTGLSLTEIRDKLNSDLERYPPPESPDPKRRLGLWGRSSVWEILHNPKYTGYQVWNRRSRKKGGKVNPPDKWVWSEAPAHEALVSREMFEKAILAGTRRDNALQKAKAHEDYRKRSYVLRSFLRCGVCGLRMDGHYRNGVYYYRCDASKRRHRSLVPEDHPASVYLREDRAGEKVVRFLQNHVFGPERVPLLRASLSTSDPEADERRAEVQRLRSHLKEIRLRIKRLVANLEAEEPRSRVAREIRDRIDDLTEVESKKERELQAAEARTFERPDDDLAAGILSALPLMEVDWEILSDDDFRDLLQTLNFEGRYDPKRKELHLKVVLLPELMPPEDASAMSPVLFVLLMGRYSNLAKSVYDVLSATN